MEKAKKIEILLFEDDYMQARGISVGLEREFPAADIIVVASEYDFYEGITNDTFGALRPNLAILDVLGRWANPSPVMPEPPREVSDGGFFGAGIRCARKLRDNNSTKSVPIIFYTVLGPEKLPQDVESLGRVIKKSGDLEPLFMAVRETLKMPHDSQSQP